MRTPLFVLTFAILAGSLMPAYGQYNYYGRKKALQQQQQQQKQTPSLDFPEDKPVSGDPGARLQALLEQRYKMYVQRDQVYQKAYNAGIVDQAETLGAAYEALRAELEQYEKPEKRIPIWQKMVDNLKLQEDFARTKAMQRAANASKSDSVLKIQGPYWRAKMSRLNDEISLERERVRAQEAAQAAAQPAAGQPATAQPPATQPGAAQPAPAAAK
jgi:hypothetical protein